MECLFYYLHSLAAALALPVSPVALLLSLRSTAVRLRSKPADFARAAHRPNRLRALDANLAPRFWRVRSLSAAYSRNEESPVFSGLKLIRAAAFPITMTLVTALEIIAATLNLAAALLSLLRGMRSRPQSRARLASGPAQPIEQ